MSESLTHRLYALCPVFVQNIACSLVGVKLKWERYNRHFGRYLKWLHETEGWSADRIRAHQDENLRRIVRWAYENVPFYKEWYDVQGIQPDAIRTQDDLHKLPILTKQTVRAHQREMIATPYRGKRLVRLLTSGTTGTALEVLMTREARAYQWAVWWRHRGRFGIHPGDNYLSFGARTAVPASQSKPPFWRRNRIGKQTYLSTYHLTPQLMPDIVAWLNRESFDFYSGYPSAIYVLANFMLENDLTIERPPKYIITGADALLPTVETAIRKAFGAPVTEQYGMAEFAGNMAKCEKGTFHLDFECCCVESLPMTDVDVQGQDRWRLLFTGWGNPVMPFIRYDVGDYGRPSKGGCSCGRASECFEAIEGRTEDYVRTPDGRMAIGMNQVFEYAPGAREIQIYQERVDAIEVRVVPGTTYGANDEVALLRELRRRLGDAIQIDFVLVDEIPRTAAGKFRAVVSTISGRSKGEQALAKAVQDCGTS